jgi:3-phytase
MRRSRPIHLSRFSNGGIAFLRRRLSHTLLLLPCAMLVACDAWGDEARPALPLSHLESAALEPAVVTDRVPGDSDDPAIWIDREDPARSIVLGTDKHPTDGGIYVFDLGGGIDVSRTIAGLRKVNNVDIEYGLHLGGRLVDIAVATEREAMALRVFTLPDMTPIDGGGIPVFDGDPRRGPMGIALYRNPGDGAVYAIVGGKDGPPDGYLWQYRLEDDGAGQVRAIKVRELGTYSGTKEIEAIAVDDELGYVYYSDEAAGIRKYHADPAAGNEELAIFGASGFVRDREGIAIYRGSDGAGYLLVSDQGGHRLQVFPREACDGRPHDHPVMAVVPVKARSTDGIEVTARSLGPDFPAGMLVMMSSDRTFHYYRWQDVAERIREVRQRGEGGCVATMEAEAMEG